MVGLREVGKINLGIFVFKVNIWIQSYRKYLCCILLFLEIQFDELANIRIGIIFHYHEIHFWVVPTSKYCGIFKHVYVVLYLFDKTFLFIYLSHEHIMLLRCRNRTSYLLFEKNIPIWDDSTQSNQKNNNFRTMKKIVDK